MRQNSDSGKIFFRVYETNKMEIQHKEGASRGKFFIDDNGERVAQIVYARDGDTLVIEHTEVEKALRNQNIGYDLVHKTVEFARSQNLKVSPVCPFAKAMFDKQQDWKDVEV